MKPIEWMRMIEQLRDAINHATAEVARHEQSLDTPQLSGADNDQRQAAWQQLLERLTARIDECQARAAHAQSETELAERALADEEQGLREFRAAIGRSRQELAKVPDAV